jgi:tRNA modification GTPase
VRLSGPAVRSVVASVFDGLPDAWPVKRTQIHGQVRLPGLHSSLPADLYLAPAPRTYTGQDTAELHTVSSPPLLDALIAALLNAGARAAQPGEFTMRAFLSGKKDLTQAEAVAEVVEAGSPDELEQALGRLAGGMTLPLQGLREDLLNLLADIEAALDFTDEDIQFVGKQDILMRLGKGMAQLINLDKQLEDRSVSNRLFRVAIVGAPNAGKSSLFNALAGLSAAIVSPIAGTTRDYITRTVPLGGLSIELVDTAGWQDAVDGIEQQAQALGRAAAKAADLILWCFDASQESPAHRDELAGVPAVLIAAKCDLNMERRWPKNIFATSAMSGQGIEHLKEHLAGRARAARRPALAPSTGRCRHHVEAALKNLRAAHSIALFDDPAELLALELRLALDHLGEMVGAIYTDDLLDRIFSRFCIGK